LWNREVLHLPSFALPITAFMNKFSCVGIAIVCLAPLSIAQCWSPSAGTIVTLYPTISGIPAHDEGRSVPVPLGFAFPMSGASLPSFTHVVIESNGVAYLTDDTPAIGPTSSGTVDFIGGAGDSPRIAPFWSPLEGPSPNWAIRTASSPGEFSIEWVAVNEWLSTVTKSFSCRLFSSGAIEFSYEPGMNVNRWSASVGVSPGNGIADPEGASDLSSGPTSVDQVVYQDFGSPGMLDLANSRVRFTPVGNGYGVSSPCALARHETFGEGCYDIGQESFFEEFVAGVLPFDLSNRALSMLRSPAGAPEFSVALSSRVFFPPSGAAMTLVLGDDSETPVSLTVPFPDTTGTFSQLHVCSNGFVSTGFASPFPFGYGPQLLSQPFSSWRTWLDLDPSQAGSGQIKFEEVGSFACFTWDGVYSAGSNLPNTMQFQFDCATGDVHMIWRGMAGALASDVLVGYSPGGPSSNISGVDLSALAGTIFLAPDIRPLQLTAVPAPVSSGSGGTVVTYSTSNMPAAGSGFYLGFHVLSLTQTVAPGLSLAPLGAPGCSAHIGSIGWAQSFFGPTSTAVATLVIPPGIPAGSRFYSQTVALFPANSLPTGLNGLGLVSSNGLASIIQPF
jgi:hypothetical protein